MGVLVGEALLNDDGFGVAGVVAEKERERGAGFDGRDGSVGGGLAEEFEALLLVAPDASDADEHADEARKTGDGELLDAHGHLGVGVAGVDAECCFAVVAGGESLAGGGDVGVVDQGDKGGVHASGVAAGEVGVGVVGVGFYLLVAEGDGGVGELFDAVTSGLGNGDVAFGGEEGVVCVVGGVQEILVVEFSEDERQKDIASGDAALGIVSLDGFEPGEGAVEVEGVKVLMGFANSGGEVDGVGVCGRIVGVRGDGDRERGREKQEAEDFNAAFYRCSPSLWTSRFNNHLRWMRMMDVDAANEILDARHRKLYPLCTRINGCCRS